MHDAGAVSRCGSGHFATQPRAKSGASPESRHFDPLISQHAGPHALVVQTAHRHRDLPSEPANQLHNEPLGATRIQRQNELENSWGDAPEIMQVRALAPTARLTTHPFP